MKYYITGANGFIGKALQEYLKGNDVVCINRNHYPFDFDDDSTVIHLAAYGNHSYQKDRSDIIRANIRMLEVMLDAFAFSSARKFYNISTSSVTLPVQTLYSSSKLFGECLVNSYNDPRMVNIRPYSVYGPGEALHRFIPTVIKHLNTGEEMVIDPGAVHDWIYIDDFIYMLFADKVNIGTGIQHTNMQVIRMLEQISGKELFYKVQKQREYDTDNWHCPELNKNCASLFDGLKATYESFTR